MSSGALCSTTGRETRSEYSGCAGCLLRAGRPRAPREAREGSRRRVPRHHLIMRDAPIIGSTSSNVTKFRMLLYAVILCVWSVRGCHSLLSFLEVDPSFTRVSKLSTHDTHWTHKVARTTKRTRTPTVLPVRGGRAGGGHNEGRGNPRMSHLSTHARECTPVQRSAN